MIPQRDAGEVEALEALIEQLRHEAAASPSKSPNKRQKARAEECGQIEELNAENRLLREQLSHMEEAAKENLEMAEEALAQAEHQRAEVAQLEELLAAANQRAAQQSSTAERALQGRCDGLEKALWQVGTYSLTLVYTTETTVPPKLF